MGAVTQPERVYCVEPHQYGPADPAAWRAWALRHTGQAVHQCPDCGLWVLWRPITDPAAEPEQLGFDTEEST